MSSPQVIHVVTDSDSDVEITEYKPAAKRPRISKNELMAPLISKVTLNDLKYGLGKRAPSPKREQLSQVVIYDHDSDYTPFAQPRTPPV